jgi:hypothetical protein
MISNFRMEEYAVYRFVFVLNSFYASVGFGEHRKGFGWLKR